jgi:pimeloyl-ACP methyl ester carboxylesterase
VESYGPADGPPLVFTHGWGADSTEWYYARKQLADTFHVIVWDLPGLGRSLQPSDQDYSLDRMADDLAAVIAGTAGGRPAVLVGHSIGGMINLTFCRRHPEALGRQVAGIVLLDTTYTNPVRTSKAAGRNTMLQKPVYEPILHATVALSPLVHRLNWLAYQSGLLHLQTHRSSFAGTETRGQLDFVTRYYKYDSPAVLARGTLGMLHWDATDVLPRVGVPVLILVGLQDRTTVPAASEQMRASMPAASLQVIDPAAHMGPIERNLTYNSAIRAFADLRLRGGPQLAGAILPARQSLPGVPARGRR